MGVTIHYRMAVEKQYVKDILDEAEQTARLVVDQLNKKGIQGDVRRLSPTTLFIDLEGCETLAFKFKTKKQIDKEAKTDWCYEKSTLFEEDGIGSLLAKQVKEDIDKYMFCSDFCKTQFAKSFEEHAVIAGLIRVVASRCELVNVFDEGMYYYSNKLEDVEEQIDIVNGIIDKITGTLKGMGYNVSTPRDKEKEVQ